MRRFRADTRGATAVEFGLVVVPFLAMTMGIMTIGVQHLTMNSLERGVAEASRQIRTGQAQQDGLTVDDFRQLFCNEAGSFITCDSRLVLHLRSGARFADLVPPARCFVDGGLAPPSTAGNADLVSIVGQENRKVSVLVCYDWNMGTGLWRSIWALISPTPVEAGRTILSASTVLQTEPYQ